MANDSRIVTNGVKLNYTCQNRRYATDVRNGYEHKEGNGYKGSVTPQALYDNGEYSLWLEHVVGVHDPNETCFWFMWYHDGIPTIPLSGVIDSESILKVIAGIKEIKF